MQVSEVMHEGVFTAQINDSLKRVAAMMKREDIGAVPVYKNERPVGFVTDRDIVISCVANGHSPEESISLAMNREIVCIYEKQDVTEAAKLMRDHQISRLLVVDEGQNPVGMITLQDLSTRTRDEHLKAQVLTEIKRS
jgi:CBS domain-containing protein